MGYCENCGCGTSNGICSNCHEELYISTYQSEYAPKNGFSDEFLYKAQQQELEITNQRK
jgi:hypothetical protein